MKKNNCISGVANKGADQFRGYRKADLRLCFRNLRKTVSGVSDQFRHKPGCTGADVERLKSLVCSEKRR